MKSPLIDAIVASGCIPLFKLVKHLRKDENNEVIILTKQMEVYLFSGYPSESPETPGKDMGDEPEEKKYILGCYCWEKKTFLRLKNTGLIFGEKKTDDRLFCFKTDIQNLPLLLSMGPFKRKPYKRGKWIQKLEKKLGHEILPYTPSEERFTSYARIVMPEDKEVIDMEKGAA